MVHVVIETGDVYIDKPFHPGPLVLDITQRRVGRSIWAESMGRIGKDGLIEPFQYQSHHFLDQFIVTCRRTQRTLASITLGDVGSPDGSGAVPILFE